MIVKVEQKKEFLEWLVNHVQYSRREVYWILNYLINHAAILNQVIFVEQSANTPRGLKISQESLGVEPIQLFIEQQVFIDPGQIFHDLRMNWKKPIYMECMIDNPWSNPFYLAVLEDNPFHMWNETLDPHFGNQLEKLLGEEEAKFQRDALYGAIDEAIEKGDREKFIILSKQLKEFDEAEKSF